MSNQVQIFNNDELNLQIRSIMINDIPYFVAKDIALILGYNDTDQTIRKNVDEEDKLTRLIDGSGQKRNMIIINESGLYALILGSKLESAKRFKHWVTSEVLPTLRKTGTYSINNTQSQLVPFEQQLKGVAFIADDLHVTKSSRIIMYKKLCESNHVSTKFLPDYVEGEDRESKTATILLKQFDLKLSTVSFNKLLLNVGILEERERNSSKGTIKKFKALTEVGLKYGKNLVSEQNPKEVQPYYYIDTFMELYHLVTSANVA